MAAEVRSMAGAGLSPREDRARIDRPRCSASNPAQRVSTSWPIFSGKSASFGKRFEGRSIKMALFNGSHQGCPHRWSRSTSSWRNPSRRRDWNGHDPENASLKVGLRRVSIIDIEAFAACSSLMNAEASAIAALGVQLSELNENSHDRIQD